MSQKITENLKQICQIWILPPSLLDPQGQIQSLIAPLPLVYIHLYNKNSHEKLYSLYKIFWNEKVMMNKETCQNSTFWRHLTLFLMIDYWSNQSTMEYKKKFLNRSKIFLKTMTQRVVADGKHSKLAPVESVYCDPNQVQVLI